MSSCGLSISCGKPHLPTSTETVIDWCGKLYFPKVAAIVPPPHLLFYSMTFLYPHQDLTSLFSLNLGKLVIALLNRDETALRVYWRKRSRLGKKRWLCNSRKFSNIVFLPCNYFCNDMENKNKPNEWVDLAKEIF